MAKEWGAIIRGEQFDLDDWANSLKKPGDPWVEVHGADTTLRSRSFDGMSSAEEVRDSAVPHIERLNGVMAAINESRPLQFGGVVEFSPEGRLHRTMFAEVGNFEIRTKVSIQAIVLGPDGKPKEGSPPAQTTKAQDWAAKADNDPILEDALVYFGRATVPRKADDPSHWFDIYRTLESLILKFGPSEKEFLALNWAPKNEIERLKRTANWARHAKRKNPPPPNPMTPGEAHDLIVVLLNKAFE